MELGKGLYGYHDLMKLFATALVILAILAILRLTVLSHWAIDHGLMQMVTLLAMCQTYGWRLEAIAKDQNHLNSPI